MLKTLSDPVGVTLDITTNTEKIYTIDLGSIVKTLHLDISLVGSIVSGGGCYSSLNYSVDGINYHNITNLPSSNLNTGVTFNFSIAPNKEPSDTFYFKINTYGSDLGNIEFKDIQIAVNTSEFDGVNIKELNYIDFGQPYSGILNTSRLVELIFEHITNPVINQGGSGEEEDPTSTNIITGNVKKLSVPFKANVVAVSLGLNPMVVGQTTSDEITGDYTLNIYPHVDEVLVYVAPDYGRAFSENLSMTTGQIIHPTTPNLYVYVAQNNGLLGSTEPNWGVGEITSNEVVFLPKPLYRPLMNGFIKPVVTPI